jgi:hypothetical protein
MVSIGSPTALRSTCLAEPRGRRRRAITSAALALTMATLSACGSDSRTETIPPGGQLVTLPGAGENIDFDDLVYAADLRRMLVPAREHGLYLVDPDSGAATRLDHDGVVDSVDAGAGLLFLLDWTARTITVVDPTTGATVASAVTAGPPDYVRYVEATNELWITEPVGAPPGVEIFALGDRRAPNLRRDGFVAVAAGSEGFAIDPGRGTGYTHAGDSLVAIDLKKRAVTAQWPTGCAQAHGFPAIDSSHGLGLAGCVDDGEVVLLDLDDGRQVARYSVGSGEALQAYSAATGHFSVRGDPGTRLVTLAASPDRLTPVGEVAVPEVGHCLTVDDRGRAWTCDAVDGQVLRSG